MKNFKKILELIRKTGDKYLVEDEQGNLFITMNLSDYEHLVLKNLDIKCLSEEEFLNKINKDIALWKAGQEDDKVAEIIEEEEKNKEDHYYFEPVEEEE